MKEIILVKCKHCARCDSCNGEGYVEVPNPDWLRSKREKAGYTQRRVASRLSISVQLVSMIEAGERECSPHVLEFYKNI